MFSKLYMPGELDFTACFLKRKTCLKSCIDLYMYTYVSIYMYSHLCINIYIYIYAICF